MTNKIALINDTHFGVKNDVQYILDYQEKFYKEVFFPTLKKHNITNIIHGGDLFDRRKFINFGSLYRTRKMFFDKLLEENIDVDLFLGNHCVYSKTNNYINSPSLLLRSYPNINIIEFPITKQFDKTSIMMIPWINGSNYKEFMEFIENNTADILYGHFELKGFAMHSSGIKNQHGINPQSFDKFKQVLSGHFHTQSTGANIKYLGAPMQFTWADYDDPRGFHLMDTETQQLTFIENPFVLYEKIYYNDELDGAQEDYKTMDLSQFDNKIIKLFVTKKLHTEIFESFIDRLYKQNLIDLSIMEDYSEFHDSNIAEIENVADCSTKDLMSKYIDNIETEMNKTKLKNVLDHWYIEALHNQSGVSS